MGLQVWEQELRGCQILPLQGQWPKLLVCEPVNQYSKKLMNGFRRTCTSPWQLSCNVSFHKAWDFSSLNLSAKGSSRKEEMLSPVMIPFQSTMIFLQDNDRKGNPSYAFGYHNWTYRDIETVCQLLWAVTCLDLQGLLHHLCCRDVIFSSLSTVNPFETDRK